MVLIKVKTKKIINILISFFFLMYKILHTLKKIFFKKKKIYQYLYLYLNIYLL